MDTFDILQKLCPAFGVSGDEREAAEAALSLLSPYGEGSFDSKNGNAVFRRSGFDAAKKTVLLDAHIDEIGFVVTYITDDGFLKVAPVGGIDRRMLLATEVTVFGREQIKGVITSTPPHLEDDDSKLPEVSDIYIDIGMSGEKAKSIVSLGDKVCVVNKPERLLGNKVTAKALDDRSGAAVLIKTIELLKDKPLGVNVVLLFSSKEEIGEMGAKTGTFDISPDMAIAVDVSFAYTQGEEREECGELSKGPMIGISPSLSRELSDKLIACAKENDIPYQLEIMNGRTGTNADQMTISKGGVKAVTVSIPEKYMHTPAEIIDLDDIENTALLLARFIGGLK